MKDISAVNCGTAAYFQGLPEMMLENIELSNASFSAVHGITIIDAINLTFTNITIDQKDETLMIIYNGKNLDFNAIEGNSNTVVKISGSQSNNILFKKSTIKAEQIKCSEYLQPNTFQIDSNF